MIIGIGTDIIEIVRIQEAITRNSRFLEKLFTLKERTHFENIGYKAETIAGFFAAKEAVSKALGTGFRSFSPKDIELTKDKLGKPQVCLLNNAKKLSNEIGINNIQVSISHCRTYAVAYVIAEGGK